MTESIHDKNIYHLDGMNTQRDVFAGMAFENATQHYSALRFAGGNIVYRHREKIVEVLPDTVATRRLLERFEVETIPRLAEAVRRQAMGERLNPYDHHGPCVRRVGSDNTCGECERLRQLFKDERDQS